MEDCFTPLVRSKQGKVGLSVGREAIRWLVSALGLIRSFAALQTYCVSCEQYYLTEEEAKKQQEEEEAKMSKGQQEREEQEEAERKHRIAQQFRLEEEAKRAREMQELEQAQARRAAAANPSGTGASGSWSLLPFPTLAETGGSAGPAKRKSEDVAADRVVEDSAVSAARRQTLAALYQVEHPHFF